MKLFILLISLTTAALAQPRPIPVPMPLPRPIPQEVRVELPRVQVRAEYRGVTLTNRGLHYVNNRINLARYFVDDGNGVLLASELSGANQIKLQTLLQDIKVHGVNFNSVLLKDLVDGYYRQLGAKSDIDALVSLIMNSVAIDAASELKDIMRAIQQQNKKKSEMRDGMRELRTSLELCRHRCTRVETARIEEMLGQLKDSLDSMNAQSEIEMQKLQAQIARRGQLLQLLNNMLRALSETARSIVQNIR